MSVAGRLVDKVSAHCFQFIQSNATSVAGVEIDA